jgi:AAA15 family ATPase/GTPase
MSESQQAYISKVHLKGYKSIRDLEIDFKPGLNIIIGPNGSGKTNFLEFLELSFNKYEQPNECEIHVYFESYGKKCVQNIKSQYSNNTKSDFHFESIEEIYQEEELVFKLRIQYHDNNSFFNKRDLLIGKNESQKLDFIPFPLLLKYGNDLDRLFEKEREGKLNIINKEDNVFITSANNLGKILIYPLVKHNSPKDFHSELNQDFIKLLKRYTPILDLSLDSDRFNIHTDENLNTHVNNILLKFLVKDKWLYWNQLSDGTKRIFYIMFNIYFYSQKIIFLEEPELGIHPDQLYKLMDFIKEQSEEKQIILTTHSPDVLNTFGKDELDRIVVTRYDEEKGTQMHHLSPRQTRKGQIYIEEVGNLSDFWVHSNLEEIVDEED